MCRNDVVDQGEKVTPDVRMYGNRTKKMNSQRVRPYRTAALHRLKFSDDLMLLKTAQSHPRKGIEGEALGDVHPKGRHAVSHKQVCCGGDLQFRWRAGLQIGLEEGHPTTTPSAAFYHPGSVCMNPSLLAARQKDVLVASSSASPCAFSVRVSSQQSVRTHGLLQWL